MSTGVSFVHTCPRLHLCAEMKENYTAMKIPCKDCICIPICLNKHISNTINECGCLRDYLFKDTLYGFHKRANNISRFLWPNITFLRLSKGTNGIFHLVTSHHDGVSINIIKT